jgi:spore coat polysaccharide biosynthesis protein SpsF
VKTAAVIQARISSTRLPGKALKKLCGLPLTQHVIERIKKINGVNSIILATGDKPENRPLLDLSESLGIESFTGSEDDVLSRYWRSVENLDCDYVIRITGDNPFIDYDSASQALIHAAKSNADHSYVKGIPLGTGVEIIKKTALEKAFIHGITPYQREHVTPYIKENPGIFKLSHFQAHMDNPFPHLRLTVDTEEDFTVAEILYNALYKGEPIPLRDVIEYVKTNPSIMNINRDVEQRPMTHSSRSDEK